MENTNSLPIQERLTNYFRARFPAIAIQTTDENRVMKDVMAATRAAGQKLMVWSAMEGVIDLSQGDPRKVEGTQDLQAAVNLSDKLSDMVFVFRDPHTWPFERDPMLLRGFRDFLNAGPKYGRTSVIIAHDFKPHPTFEKLVTIIDFALPEGPRFTEVAAGLIKKTGLKIEVPDQDTLRALGGLTESEAENALSLSIIETRTFDPKVLYREKIASVKRSGLLEIVEPDPRGLDAIGGLDNLKQWILSRRKAWSPNAVAYGLKAPKGIMLVGVQGCGKSLAAKCIGTALDIPTLKLDVGSLYNSLVGETERRTREALALAAAMSPCVLWLDELDKAFAGAGGSGSGDSGVGKRLFGTVLTWMQERSRPVFLFATANDVSQIPGAMLRKGRFDEIFSLDLPTEDERETIFSIHLKQRKRDPKDFNLKDLADSTKNFSGSEIESVVEDGMFRSFCDDERPLTTGDMVKAALSTTPLAELAKDEVESIREWARKTKARPASQSVTAPLNFEGGRKLSV